MNKSRRRAIQKHRARELKFEARRKTAEGANAPAAPIRASAPPRPRPAARSIEQAAAAGADVGEQTES